MTCREDDEEAGWEMEMVVMEVGRPDKPSDRNLDPSASISLHYHWEAPHRQNPPFVHSGSRRALQRGRWVGPIA